MWLKTLKWLFPWLLLALMAPLSAFGAEFSAMLVLKQKGKVMPGKIYIKDAKMRQDFIDENGYTITIVRRDKKRVWIIMPWEKKYVDLPLGVHLPGQFLEIPPEAASRRRVCTEEICGFQADRIQVTLPDGSLETYWVAPKLGLPIKKVCRGDQYCVEYSNIRERKLEDRLFEVPKDCKKVASSTYLY
jgi:hypothetical protein